MLQDASIAFSKRYERKYSQPGMSVPSTNMFKHVEIFKWLLDNTRILFPSDTLEIARHGDNVV